MTQPEIKQIWKQFISGQPIDESALPPEILDSWKRSKLAGVNPKSEKLCPPQTEHALYIYEQSWKFQEPILRPYLDGLHSLKKEHPFAYCFCDTNLEMVICRGNPSFIDMLRKRNLACGTFFTEESVGTNAAALSIRDGKPHTVLGAQHYCTAFHDLATLAYPYKNFGMDRYKAIIFICSLAQYSNILVSLLDSTITLMLTSLRLAQKEIEANMTYHEVGHIYNQSNKGCIFVNQFGNILWINKNAAKKALVKKENYFGSVITDVFPELSPVMAATKAGNNLELFECQFVRNGIMQVTYVDAAQYKTKFESGGVFITLHDSKQINKQLAHAAGLQAKYHFDDIIGESPAIAKARKDAQLAAASDSCVLLLGETGTGKELFAQAIHNASRRSAGPFVAVNCAAITRELIGSELFGYVEGSFTGARKGGAPGKFELANEGTLFLDEIGDMPLDMQVVLLRALEDHAITRIGGAAPIPVNVRLIAATNCNLREKVNQGTFRTDLYYRINVLNISIPPLRERSGDVEMLSLYYMQQFSKTFWKDIHGYTPEAMQCLNSYSFPGNVRELRNITERIIHKTSSHFIQLDDLPEEILEYRAHMALKNTDVRDVQAPAAVTISLPSDPEDKRTLLVQLIEKHRGNKSMVAKELGISRPTLYRMLEKFDLS